MKKIFYTFSLLILLPILSFAATYYVDDSGSNGDGSLSNPFNNFSDALNAAQPGDVIMVLPGTYSQDINTERSGQPGQRIVIQAYDPANRPLISTGGGALSIDHSYITVDGLIFDGEFDGSDVVKISSGGDNTILRNCEIRNGTKDGIDMNEADDVLIENCEIHHMLGGSLSNQVDAHGIVATGEQNLTIRGCNIYYTSGDCFQTDPNRDYPLWDNVLIENCTLWTGPLPADAADWNAGEIPGENAIDTKINEDAVGTSYRAKITLRHVTAYGFVPGYINNRAAFNIKEKVDCLMEGVVAYGNEIGFRLRGPGGRGGAYITMINCISYDNDIMFRVEDDLEVLKIYNSTFDLGNGNEYFDNVSGGYDPNGLDVRNSLFTGEKPDEASHSSNLLANSSFFIDMSGHNYHLSLSSPAINAGVDIPEVTDDFDGNPRNSGSYDVGAYEGGTITGIGDELAGDEVANDFYLYPNYPNPFNPGTRIAFRINRAETVQLSIYNLLGQAVRTLVSGQLAEGLHNYTWDGRNDFGNPVSSGIYIYRLEAGSFTQTRKMHLIR